MRFVDYEPHSPYEFSVFPADILGQVYEQFLGQVIRLTPGGRAVVEEKPEVRKAGGVYYTPTYIVEYIVRQTVGRLVAGHTPDPTGPVSRLRVLDPACGSGSFLLGAYQFLLDWHLDGYLRDTKKWSRKRGGTLHLTAAGDYVLTLAERRRILLDNLYGVDIDPQAVEVTKLSLLLKVLEGAAAQLGPQAALLGERVLPDLDSNIKCGNSLIGPEFYDRPQPSLLGDDELLRVNAFDWRGEFAEIMRAGGFDAVIGNPPYIFTRNQGIETEQKAYYYSRYKHQSAQLNSFGIFLEKAHSLLRQGGQLGFITPNNLLTIDSFALLRRFVIENTSDTKFVNILDKVFSAASVDNAILLFSKASPNVVHVAELSTGEEVFHCTISPSEIRAPQYIVQINLFKNQEHRKLLEKIELNSRPLSMYSVVSTGLKAYQTGKGKPPQSDRHKKDRVFHSHARKDDNYEPYLRGVDVSRYALNWSGEYISYGEWLAEPRRSVPFDGPRLLVRQIPSRPPYLVHGVYTNKLFYHDINSMVIFSPKYEISLLYLLGVVNSALISFWFQKTYDKLQRKVFPQFKVKELGLFPIRTIDPTNPTDIAQHARLVALVQQMLDLHQRAAAEGNPQVKTLLQRQIDATDKQIDRLVYGLYGLTEAEVGVVEAEL